MNQDLSSIISVQQVPGQPEKYSVRYLVFSKPLELPEFNSLQKYYEDIAYDIARQLDCKLASDIEVQLNPVNESATLQFTLKIRKNGKDRVSPFSFLQRRKRNAFG